MFNGSDGRGDYLAPVFVDVAWGLEAGRPLIVWAVLHWGVCGEEGGVGVRSSQ